MVRYWRGYIDISSRRQRKSNSHSSPAGWGQRTNEIQQASYRGRYFPPWNLFSLGSRLSHTSLPEPKQRSGWTRNRFRLARKKEQRFKYIGIGCTAGVLGERDGWWVKITAARDIEESDISIDVRFIEAPATRNGQRIESGYVPFRRLLFLPFASSNLLYRVTRFVRPIPLSSLNNSLADSLLCFMLDYSNAIDQTWRERMEILVPLDG